MKPRIPKGDVPSLAYFFLVLVMMVVMFSGVFVGAKGLGEILREMLAVLVWAAM